MGSVRFCSIKCAFWFDPIELWAKHAHNHHISTRFTQYVNAGKIRMGRKKFEKPFPRCIFSLSICPSSLLYKSGKYCVSSHLNNCTHTLITCLRWEWQRIGQTHTHTYTLAHIVVQSTFNQGNGTRTIRVLRERMQIPYDFWLQGADHSIFLCSFTLTHGHNQKSVVSLFFLLCSLNVHGSYQPKQNKKRSIYIYFEKVDENEC